MKYLFLLAMLFTFSTVARAADCGNCHGTPPGDRSHTIHSGLNVMKTSYGDAGFTSQYSPDAMAYGFNCGNCHPRKNNFHENGIIEIDLARSSDGLRALNSVDARYDREKKRCFGVYCHSTGEGGTRVRYVTSPQWNREEKGSRCQECHLSPPAYGSTPERRNGHFNSSRSTGHLLAIHWDSVKGHTKDAVRNNLATQMDCSTCHYDTVRKGTGFAMVDTNKGWFTCVRCHELSDGDIFNYSRHVNGSVEVTFAPLKVRSAALLWDTPKGWKRAGRKMRSGSYDEAAIPLTDAVFNKNEKSCGNVSCHLYEKVNWHQTINCGDCHVDFKGGGMKKQ